jgi:intracellular sulfur oxidation DsrE/DsrF family protein
MSNYNTDVKTKLSDIKKFSEVLNNYNNFAKNIENAEIKIYSPVEAQELIKDLTNSKNADFMSGERVNNRLKEIYLNYKE